MTHPRLKMMKPFHRGSAGAALVLACLLFATIAAAGDGGPRRHAEGA
jgi:hypothetical protein